MITEPISYVFSKIFKYRECKPKDNQSGAVLSIRKLPPLTFQLLVANGLFDQDRIEQALKQTEHLTETQTLPPCAMIQALTSWDPSLHSLMCLLASPTLLCAPEITHALRSGLDLFQASQSAAPDTKLLTNSSPPISPRLTNGHASPSPSPSPAPLSDTLHDAGALIQLCLARLPDHADAAVTAALRHVLGAARVPRLLDYLRAALAGAGWFTRYADPSPRASPAPTDAAAAAPPPADHYLAHAARVIGCALDALGAAAWLAPPGVAAADDDDDGAYGTGGGDEGQQRVAHLRAEISAALEAVEEAAYLDGLLREVLLYARHAAPERGAGDDAVDAVAREQARGVTQSGRGRARPVKMDVDEEERSLMPLGLRPVGTVEGEKKGGDGRPVKRSMRELGHLKSRKVGAYSFERIVV